MLAIPRRVCAVAKGLFRRDATWKAPSSYRNLAEKRELFIFLRMVQRTIPHRPVELNPGHLRLPRTSSVPTKSRARVTYFPDEERYVSDMRLIAFSASVTLHLVYVQAIDSNANNLVHVPQPEYLPALLFPSRVSSSREILSGRQPVHRIHQSGAMRATSKSPYIVNSSAVYTPRIVKPFPRDVESRASALGKRLQSLNSRTSRRYLIERVLWDMYLMLFLDEKEWFKTSGYTLLRCCNIDILKLGQPIAPYDSWVEERTSYVWLYIPLLLLSSYGAVLVTLFHFMLSDVLSL